MASRVPAWKRLGLKLKSEPEPVVEALVREEPTYDSVAPPSRKRSRSPEPEVKTSKKSKKDKVPKPILRSERSASPQKAVQFAPDAKQEDGDSIKKLFGAWVDEQKRNDPTFVSVKEKQQVNVNQEPLKNNRIDNRTSTAKTPPKPVKTVLKPAKPAKKPKTPKGQTPKPFAPALDYLKTFHENKQFWKFNKINQTLILKHAFDIELIPAEYNDHLQAYVAGMKGMSRIHLRDRALEVRDKDVEDGIEGFPADMENREEHQANYERWLAEDIATEVASKINEEGEVTMDEAKLLGLNTPVVMRERLARRKRVDTILETLANTPGDPTDYVPVKANEQVAPEVTLEEATRLVVPVAPPAPEKKVRNRKKRTAAIESDSESSDSDSDSESNDEDKPSPAKKAKVAAESDSDSSEESDSDDSSSSSSSSDSDSDSDSIDSD